MNIICLNLLKKRNMNLNNMDWLAFLKNIDGDIGKLSLYKKIQFI